MVVGAAAGTFPFGWIRGFREDNWQIIWDPSSKAVLAKAAVSKEVVPLGECSTWQEAKVFADSAIDDINVLIKAV